MSNWNMSILDADEVYALLQKKITELKAVVDVLDSVQRYIGVTTTVLTDGATTNPIEINGASVTAINGDVVIYNGEDFVFNEEIWQSVPNAFGALAYRNSIYDDVTDIPYGSIEDVVYRLKAEPRKTASATVYKRNTAANAEELAHAFTIEEDEYEGADGYVARPKENTIVATSDGVIRAIWFGDTFDTFINIGDEPYTMTETSEDFTLWINKYKFYMGNSTTQTAAEIATKFYVDDAIAAITDYESEVFPNG